MARRFIAPNSGLDSYSLAAGSGSTSTSGNSAMATGSDVGRVRVIYLKQGNAGDKKFTEGLTLMQGFLQKKFSGYVVTLDSVTSLKAAESIAKNNPYDFSFAIVHGVFSGGVYQGTIKINGTEVPDSRVDNNRNFDAAFHCGQGPGGTTINLGQVYKSIVTYVTDFVSPFYYNTAAPAPQGP